MSDETRAAVSHPGSAPQPDGDVLARGSAAARHGAGDAALEAARVVLAANGLSVGVERAGHAGDMLVIQAPPARIDDVRACAVELRRLGFRYVTIEISPDA